MWAVASRGGRGGCQDQPGGASLWALAQLTSWLPYLGNLAAAQPAGQGLLPRLPPQTGRRAGGGSAATITRMGHGQPHLTRRAANAPLSFDDPPNARFSSLSPIPSADI